MSARLPSAKNRTMIVGSTGSGKTQFAVWLLSTRDFDRRPWFVIDYKGDELINEIGAIDIEPTSKPPRDPGIYRLRLVPENDDERLEQFFYALWARGNAGIYIDEGYMIPKRSKAFKAILTQGRSKRIEVITLVQRPRFLPDKFMMTEAQYYAFFNLTNRDDRKYLLEVAEGYNPDFRLPKYHSLWYDVDRQAGTLFGPVPSRNDLIKSFREKLGRKVHAI